jgi:hypothetical protein
MVEIRDVFWGLLGKPVLGDQLSACRNRPRKFPRYPIPREEFRARHEAARRPFFSKVARKNRFSRVFPRSGANPVFNDVSGSRRCLPTGLIEIPTRFRGIRSRKNLGLLLLGVKKIRRGDDLGQIFLSPASARQAWKIDE